MAWGCSSFRFRVSGFCVQGLGSGFSAWVEGVV